MSLFVGVEAQSVDGDGVLVLVALASASLGAAVALGVLFCVGAVGGR